MRHKLDLKKRGIILLISGFLFILSSFQFIDNSIVLSALVAAGVVFLLRGYRLVFKDKKEIERDERTIKIGGYAAAYSWFFGILVCSIVFWMDYSGAVLLSTRNAVGIVLFSLIFSFILFKIYFHTKGDL